MMKLRQSNVRIDAKHWNTNNSTNRNTQASVRTTGQENIQESSDNLESGRPIIQHIEPRQAANGQLAVQAKQDPESAGSNQVTIF